MCLFFFRFRFFKREFKIDAVAITALSVSTRHTGFAVVAPVAIFASSSAHTDRAVGATAMFVADSGAFGRVCRGWRR